MKTLSKKRLVNFLGMALLSLYLMPVARAETRREQRHAAFEQCAAKNNITLPEKGSGQRLDKESRTVIQKCMTEAGFKMHSHHHKMQQQESAEGVSTPS